MHEGDHGIIEDAQSDFEAKFGCTDCKTTPQGHNKHEHDHDHGHSHDHDHDHDHHHEHSPDRSDRMPKIVAGIVVAALAVAFILFRVL